MPEDGDCQPYVIVERHGSGLLAFFCGAILGVAAGMLLAPKAGAETQAALRAGGRRLREGAEDTLTGLRGNLKDQYGRLRSEVEDRVESVREGVRGQQRIADQAIKAGKTAARQARSELEARLAESKAEYATKKRSSGDGPGGEGDAARANSAEAGGSGAGGDSSETAASDEEA